MYYVGCYFDYLPWGRDYNGLNLNSTVNLNTGGTIESCVNYCLALGFKYATVQNGYNINKFVRIQLFSNTFSNRIQLLYRAECYCGSKYGANNMAITYGNYVCNKPCANSPSDVCGGTWANSVYLTKQARKYRSIKLMRVLICVLKSIISLSIATCYIGCFKDSAGSDLNALLTTSTSMTLQQCRDFCANYSYAALQNGSEYNLLV